MKVHPKDIYLEVEEFKKFCNENHVQVSDEILEAYEKHGLIYPVYRLNRPHEYLQIIFEQNHKPLCPDNIIEVPEQYGSLLQFEYKELVMWPHPELPGFEKALSDGHPLDQAYKRGKEFIIKPSEATFKNWDEYKVVLETEHNGQVIKDQKSTARHYYSPWQIYLLEEANTRHIRRINVLIPLKEGQEYIFNEQPYRLMLNEWQEHFKTLWEYKFKENLTLEKAFRSVQGNILEGGTLKKFHEDCKNEAIPVYLKHSYESWINFLRILCGLYFRYQNEEKFKLSLCLKKDVRRVIDLVMLGADKNYKEIIDDVGMVIGGHQYFHIPPLERIYPEYESYLRREALPELQSTLDNYNKIVPDDLKIENKAIDEIIDHAFKIGNETLVVSIIGIKKEYFEPSYFDNEGIWSYIRSLAVAVESWVKEIAHNSDFRNAIGTLTKNKFGKNLFDTCCDQLQNKLGKTNMKVYSYADLKQFLDELKIIKFGKNSNKLSWMRYLIRAYLIRHYVAHHTKLESELFGSTLIEIYNSLLFLVFYVWKVHV